MAPHEDDERTLPPDDAPDPTYRRRPGDHLVEPLFGAFFERDLEEEERAAAAREDARVEASTAGDVGPVVEGAAGGSTRVILRWWRVLVFWRR